MLPSMTGLAAILFLLQPTEAEGGLRSYLERPRMFSPRFLDHGVISVGFAGGLPHRSRFDIGIGLLDHLTVGVSGMWLFNEKAPRWSPMIALAAFRHPNVELGFRYFGVHDGQRSGLPSTQWIVAVATFGHRWVTGGFEAGVYRERVIDPLETDTTTVVWCPGGGLHLRAGTRRWGVTASAFAPRYHFDIAIEVRFGAFERRPRGGWSPINPETPSSKRSHPAHD